MNKYPFQITKMPNGLRIITAEMPHMESVAVGVWAGVGGRHETLEFGGISHFLEHVCFKGTKRRTARQISQAIEGVGGNMNGFTSEETTCYYAKVRYPKFERALDVLLDVFRHSLFAPAEIERERGVIKEEVRMYMDMPQQLVYEDFNAAVWQDHPLGRSLLGTFESIDRISRKDLVSFRETYYTPDNSIVSVVGNVRHEDVVKAVRRRTADWRSSRATPPLVPFRGRQRMPRIHFRVRPIEQAHAVMGFRAVSRKDPDRFPLKMLSTILGENMSSRLNHEIREKRGWAYSVHSHVTRFLDTGALLIGLGTDAGNLTKALKLILAICAGIAEKGVKPIELRHAKEFVRGNVALAMERTTEYMIWLGENLLTTNEVLSIDDALKRYDSVTLDGVQRVARRIFRDKGLNLALVSPEVDRKEIAALASLE